MATLWLPQDEFTTLISSTKCDNATNLIDLTKPKYMVASTTAADNLKHAPSLFAYGVCLMLWLSEERREKSSKDGDRFWRMPECYIRGNTIKYLRVPDEVIDKVQEETKSRSDRKPPGVGRGRGRGRDDSAAGRPSKGIGRGIDDGGSKGGGRGKGVSGSKSSGNRGGGSGRG
ncbi:hypothetical protein Pfo_005239 [Paulownia fortunei]|nr:hypothetical protein Pfo_005239 [Paulownia fortunei]